VHAFLELLRLWDDAVPQLGRPRD